MSKKSTEIAKVNMIDGDGEIVDTKEMSVSAWGVILNPNGKVIGYEASALDGCIWRPVRKDSKDDTWRMWA